MSIISKVFFSLVFFSLVFFFLGMFFYGFVVQRFFSKKDSKTEVQDNIKTTKIDVDEERYLKLCIEDWKIIIQTQMHFNDLILRFRSITLSAFISFCGVFFILARLDKIEKNDYFCSFGLLIGFWFATFLLDYFYYQKLLTGSVKHASKYDKDHDIMKYGLFGMTESISLEITPMKTRIVIWTYYILPIMFAIYIFFIHQ